MPAEAEKRSRAAREALHASLRISSQFRRSAALVWKTGSVKEARSGNVPVKRHSTGGVTDTSILDDLIAISKDCNHGNHSAAESSAHLTPNLFSVPPKCRSGVENRHSILTKVR